MLAGTITISDAIARYLDSVNLNRSANTARTYRNGMAAFTTALVTHKLPPEKSPLTALPEDAIVWLAIGLKDSAPTTERLYLTAAAGFYEFVAAENLAPINLARIHLLIHQRSRRPGQRLPQFPKNAIDIILEKVETLAQKPVEPNHPGEHLRNLRDRAFLLTLADTGLRVHEACNLRRGDIDWHEGRAIVLGKGNREAVVRFSQRAQTALKEYLAARAQSDGHTGKALTALPLFARHDKGAGQKISPITTATGRNIVNQRVIEFLGPESSAHITPHSFRHYFVTRVLQTSGNLKLAQELARHRNIAVTQRYAHLSDHELDRGYWNVFEKGKKENPDETEA